MHAFSATATDLGPTLGFLAALLVLTEQLRAAGVFSAIGAQMAARGGEEPRRLLGIVFLTASLVTALLNLDAAVVLLTPVVLATLTHRGWPRDPHLLATAHLANSASLLLPVSNLTNLLAFQASGLSFTRFSAVMALPWLAAIAAEWLSFRVVFRGQLTAAPRQPSREADPPPPIPRIPAVVVALTLAGFVVTSPFSVAPAWVAAAGALAMAVHNRAKPLALVRAAQPGFLAVVFLVGVAIKFASLHGLGHLASQILPRGSSLICLLGIAGVAAITANLINNLPATLLLAPIAAAGGPIDVLAVLVGVNIGPNLTPAGSLATLLWARVLRAHRHRVPYGTLARLGLLSVPLALAAATVALFLMRGLLPAH